jgi:preprotein translocase subunit SecA
LGLAGDALKAEDEHLLRTVNTLLENSHERMEGQVKERQDALDTFFEGLSLGEGEEAAPRSPREVLDELIGLVHVNIRLTPEEMRMLRDNPDKVQDAVRNQVENAVINQSTLRLVGAVERRLEDTLDLDVSELEGDDWEKLADQVYQAVQVALRRRRERLMGTDSGAASGQLSRDIENYLSKVNGPISTNHLLGLLLMMPQGSKAGFDKKTHRRIVQRTTRLTYIYLAAHLLGSKEPQAVTEDVLKHLQSAQQTIQRAWGAGEFARMAQARLPELEPQLRETLCTLLGEETCASLQTQPLQSLTREQIITVMDELGKRALTEVYRQLLLGVITELWVEYLTQMEALRVSIGLEAYGQRDPLVEYKSKASVLFQNLLKDMRSGVILRMFTFRPRSLSSVQSEVQRQTQGEDLEGGIRIAPEISELAGGDGDEATEQELVEGMEAEPDLEDEEQEAESSNQAQMSRSQKRRRHRK